MATRMSSGKTLRSKTLNRGATDAETRILAYLKRRNKTVKARIFGFESLSLRGKRFLDVVEQERADDIAWIENISKRANKRKGGLGRK